MAFVKKFIDFVKNLISKSLRKEKILLISVMFYCSMLIRVYVCVALVIGVQLEDLPRAVSNRDTPIILQ